MILLVVLLDDATQEIRTEANYQKLEVVLHLLNYLWMTFHLCTRSWSPNNPQQRRPSMKMFLSYWKISFARHVARENLNQSLLRFK